jgi:hypothetical protein
MGNLISHTGKCVSHRETLYEISRMKQPNNRVTIKSKNEAFGLRS